MEFELQKFTAKHLDRVLELLTPLWGHLTIQQRKEYFKWKYLNTPCNIDNKAFIAIHENKVVAFRGYFITPYILNKQVYHVASYSDAIVSLDFQGKGVFKKLTKYSMEQLSSSKLMYNTISNDTWRTSKSYMKLGSQKLDDKNVLYALTKFKLSRSKNFKVEKSDKFKINLFLDLYKKADNKSNKIHFPAKEDFWNWRYENPVTSYKFLYLWKGEEVVGFLSYYEINKNRASILDCQLQDIGLMKHFLVYFSKNEGISLVQMWSISKSEFDIKTLKKIGFKRYDKVLGLIKKESLPPVLIRPGLLDLKDENWFLNGLDIRKSRNWDINLINSDGI